MDQGRRRDRSPPDASPAGLHTGAGRLKHRSLSNWDKTARWFNSPSGKTQRERIMKNEQSGPLARAPLAQPLRSHSSVRNKKQNSPKLTK